MNGRPTLMMRARKIFIQQCLSRIGSDMIILKLVMAIKCHCINFESCTYSLVLVVLQCLLHVQLLVLDIIVVHV